MTVRVRRRRAKNFNPRTPCGVRPIRGDCPVFHNFISIHAPLAGCDELRDLQSVTERDFNPRTPCGVRPRCPSMRPRPAYFNPRTPCGVRRFPSSARSTESNFNPRTPCGVRPGVAPEAIWTEIFQSTHPLRGATHIAVRRILHELFQSTHPLRGATLTIMQGDQYAIISIHAPLAGCDRAAQFVIGKRDDFNPRTPCGVRQMSCSGNSKSYQFQSTHPLRGATDDLLKKLAKAIFQSTHPLRGATQIIRRFSLSN